MKKKFSIALVLIMGTMIVNSAFVLGSVSKIKTGTVTGQIAIKGVGPMLGGTVLLFDKAAGPPPSPTKYWRVPTYTFRLDDNARFTADLPAGEYYIGAIEKLSGEPQCPPQEGEYFLISQDRNGKPRSFTVRNHKTLNLGMSTAAKPFSRSSLAVKGITAVEGTIRNDKGVPVEGVLIFAYSSPSTADRPLFVSDLSDKDGNYQLRLSGSEKYYLRARKTFAVPLAADALTGVYKDGKAVSVKTNAVKKNIDITVTALVTTATQS